MPEKDFEFMKDQEDFDRFQDFFNQRQQNVTDKKVPVTYEDYFNGYFEQKYDVQPHLGEKLTYFIECDLHYPPHLHDFLSK